MTSEMMKKILKNTAKKNKYGANKVTAPDGTKFDSQHEYHRWCELKLMERAGLITNLQRQVKFELLEPIYEYYHRYSDKTGKRLKDGQRLIEHGVSYVADFVYIDCKTGETVVEDAKGMKTEAYKIKKKLMAHKGIRIQEV